MLFLLAVITGALNFQKSTLAASNAAGHSSLILRGPGVLKDGGCCRFSFDGTNW
jgi:hypothetical protein